MEHTQLSNHFQLSEFLNLSKYPDNIPSHAAIENLKRLCGWLEMLRSEVATSNHLTGCAVDIRVLGMEQLLRYAVILLDISDESQEDFDELLMERNAKGTYWLHFAVRPEGNRRKIRLIAC